MKKAKASQKLKLSTVRSNGKGVSPRVSAVLSSLKPGEWTQSALAAAAQINRGVLNQLWQGKTSSSPMLIGRLCAVLARDDAKRLLAAYLDEVVTEVALEEQAIDSNSKRGPLKTDVVVSYPPAPVSAA